MPLISIFSLLLKLYVFLFLPYVLFRLFISDTMVRLSGGSKPANGRIEILHNGLWGTICDTHFDKATATVICTMLGYNNS